MILARFAMRVWVGILTLAMPWATFRISTDRHPKTGTLAPTYPRRRR